MKRSELKRKTPLKSYTPLKSKTRIKMVSKKQAVKNASWRKTTDEKAESLNHTCQWCGQTGQRISPELPGYLDGHHTIKRRFNVHTPDVCYIVHRLPCHREIEDNNIDVRVYPNREFWLRRENVIKMT
jgi:hypothetical protein